MDITGVTTLSSSEVLPFQPSHAPMGTAGCLSPGLDLGAEKILIQLCTRWVESQDAPSAAKKKKKKALQLLLGTKGEIFSGILHLEASKQPWVHHWVWQGCLHPLVQGKHPNYSQPAEP